MIPFPVRRPAPRPALVLLILTLASVVLGPNGCTYVERLGNRRAAQTQLQSGRGAIGRRSNVRGLTAAFLVSPDPVKLGEVRQVDVTFVVRNEGRQPASLKFVTTQRIEILWRDPANDKVLSQWSTDRTFDPKGGYLIINPQERLEFREAITTRDLKPGRTYNLETYLVGYDETLRVVKAITPLP